MARLPSARPLRAPPGTPGLLLASRALSERAYRDSVQWRRSRRLLLEPRGRGHGREARARRVGRRDPCRQDGYILQQDSTAQIAFRVNWKIEPRQCHVVESLFRRLLEAEISRDQCEARPPRRILVLDDKPPHQRRDLS